MFEECIAAKTPESIANLVGTAQSFYQVYKAFEARIVERAARKHAGEFLNCGLYLGLLYADVDLYSTVKHAATDAQRLTLDQIKQSVDCPTTEMFTGAIKFHRLALSISNLQPLQVLKNKSKQLAFEKAWSRSMLLNGAYAHLLSHENTKTPLFFDLETLTKNQLFPSPPVFPNVDEAKTFYKYLNT